jgi:hypothetical protein
MTKNIQTEAPAGAKPKTWMGTTAEKEGMTEEEFKRRTVALQQQLDDYKINREKYPEIYK